MNRVSSAIAAALLCATFAGAAARVELRLNEATIPVAPAPALAPLLAPVLTAATPGATPVQMPLPSASPSAQLRALGNPAPSAAFTAAAAAAFDGALEPECAENPACPEPVRGPPTAPTRLRRFFKTGVALGAVAAAASPAFYGAAPILNTVYVGVATALVGAFVWAASQIIGAATGRRKNLRGFWAGAVMGVAIAAGPIFFQDAIVPAVARVVMPERQVAKMPPAFADEVVAVMSKNAEGRRILEGLRDATGRLRLPALYLAKLDRASGLSLPLVDGVFFDRMAPGLDAELLDDEALKAYVRSHEENIAHELFHAVQFRRLIQPGQLEHFPAQLLSVMTRELEYETYFHQNLYAHEMLKADPNAIMLSDDYERFIDDLDVYLRTAVDDSPTYGAFIHVDARRYREFREDARARMPQLRAQGYELLAKRYLQSDPKRSAMLAAKARAARLTVPG
jgi:hypothetical protein